MRFALSQLRAQNGAHRFEDLCRALARRTVAANILPATGPVGAGGDQGRDFETFRPAVQTGDLAKAIDPRIDVDGTIAFVCTLQQDVLPKIRADVRNVVSQGEPVETVVAYCEVDVPVARRHRLEAEMAERHDIKLVLFDGNAITELLTAHRAVLGPTVARLLNVGDTLDPGVPWWRSKVRLVGVILAAVVVGLTVITTDAARPEEATLASLAVAHGEDLVRLELGMHGGDDVVTARRMRIMGARMDWTTACTTPPGVTPSYEVAVLDVLGGSAGGTTRLVARESVGTLQSLALQTRGQMAVEPFCAGSRARLCVSFPIEVTIDPDRGASVIVDFVDPQQFAGLLPSELSPGYLDEVQVELSDGVTLRSAISPMGQLGETRSTSSMPPTMATARSGSVSDRMPALTC